MDFSSNRPDAALYTNRAFIPDQSDHRAHDRLKTLKDLINDANTEVNQKYTNESTPKNNGTHWSNESENKMPKKDFKKGKRVTNDYYELDESVLTRENVDLGSMTPARKSLPQRPPLSPRQQNLFNAEVKQTSFLASTSGKVVAILGLILGVGTLAGGAAGLSYYLGTQNAVVVSNNASSSASLIDSNILTATEKVALISLVNLRTWNLLYRGSRDGFFASTFHSRCDNRNPTVTVVRSTLNSVFGGYTNALWNSCGCFRTDSSAFIFSLRRRGFNSTERFSTISCCNQIYASASFGPTFGSGYDILIADNCDINTQSYTLCNTYTCPSGGSTHLAGTQSFTVSEIEVYQVS